MSRRHFLVDFLLNRINRKCMEKLFKYKWMLSRICCTAMSAIPPKIRWFKLQTSAALRSPRMFTLAASTRKSCGRDWFWIQAATFLAPSVWLKWYLLLAHTKWEWCSYWSKQIVKQSKQIAKTANPTRFACPDNFQAFSNICKFWLS